MSEPQRVRLRSGIQTINGITGETGPLYSEYVLASDYDALRAEVEAHKRSRQIDANELRSMRALLTECAQWLQVLLEGDKLTPKGIRELAPFIETVAAAGRDADPTDPSPASAPGNPPSPAPPPSAG